MASYQILKSDELGVFIEAMNEGDSLIPNQINIADALGDNVTFTLEQIRGVKILLDDLLKHVDKLEARQKAGNNERN